MRGSKYLYVTAEKLQAESMSRFSCSYMTSLRKILTAICFVTSHVAAQWYDHPPSDLGYVPPIGWTYVLQSDSVVWNSSNAHNFITRHDSI